MLEWCDGFDHYGLGAPGIALALNGAYATLVGDISNVNPRTGVASLVCEGNSVWRRVFKASGTKFGVGGAFYCPALPGVAGSTFLFNFQDNNAGSQVQIRLDTSGTISAWQGVFAGALLGMSSGPVVPAKAYTHVEAAVFCATSGGSVEVRVNGVTVISATGVNTNPTGYGSLAQVAGQTTFSDSGFQLDDLFAWNGDGVLNNDFLGDKKVYTVVPNADTAQADWTPSSGSAGWAMISNIPPVDASNYIQAENAGELSVFGLGNLPGTVVSIAGVVIATRMWKTDAGSSHVTPGMLSESANADGDNHSITSAPTYWHDVFEVDPATGALWTVAGFNAADYYIDRTL